MRVFFKVVLGLFVGIIVLSVVFGVLGTMIGLTFGVFGAFIGLVMRIVFSPVTWILFLIYLFYKYTKRAK